MKKNVSKRVLSGFLAFVMVFLLIPFGVLTVSANADYSVPTTGHKLLSSYNVFSGKDIGSGDAQIISALDIFNREKWDTLLQNYTSYTNMHTQYGEVHEGKDMSSFSASAGASISRSIGASIGVEKLFKLSAQKKFSLSANVSYEEVAESYFYEYVVKVQKGYYSFNDANLDEIRDFSNGYLSQTFINALTGKDGSTPEEFFDAYGTHIITAYTAGGEAGVSLRSDKTSSAISADIAAEYATGGDQSATSSQGITLGMDNALNLKLSIAGKAYNEGYSFSAHTYAYGGDNAVTFDFNNGNNGSSFNYESWLNSLNSENSMILVDERLELVPIWNLMPIVGNEDRILELTSYFLEMSEQQDAAFYEYFHVDESLFDYSKDWMNFENCTIITNEQELNDMRNDLNGVYVLANNITLSEYADWTPIGTKDEPFRGRLYGNYNTISGLNMSATASEDPMEKTLVGLFGCNDGLVSDLRISGNITMSEAVNATNVYIGAIAGYNTGIINNCYDNVTYDVAYGDFSKLNLPLREVAPESVTGNTIVIGDELGVRLSGEYYNVNIEVADIDANTPAYIVLDGATVVGSIHSDNDRPIYIISRGESNSIAAPTGNIAINASSAAVSIFGDSSLTVIGGVGNRGHDVGVGENTGGTGGVGWAAIYTNSLAVIGAKLVAIGGNGGAGAPGGIGHNGNGGNGGRGGDGGVAIHSDSVSFYSSSIRLVGGCGGDGGYGGAAGRTGFGNLNLRKGGYGGNGGNGGDIFSNDAFVESYKLASYEVVPGSGGHGGIGGEGDPDENHSKGDREYSGSNGTSGYSKYNLFAGHSYICISDFVTWEEAKAACEELGGHLVTITSAEENQLVKTLVKTLSGSEVWIGATDENIEGSWEWITGETFSYINWDTGSPDNYLGVEHYAAIRPSGFWNDGGATSKLSYICEWDNVENDANDAKINAELHRSTTGDLTICDTSSYGAYGKDAYGNTYTDVIDLSKYSDFFTEDTTFIFSITMKMSEIHDGYQEVHLYNQNTLFEDEQYTEAEIKSHGWITGKADIKHGASLDTKIYKHTVVLTATGDQLSDNVYLRYDANGEDADSWILHDISVNVDCLSLEIDNATISDVPSVLAGVICGDSAEGVVRSANKEVWHDLPLQISSVSKTEYFSGDVFDSTTVEVKLYDKLISSYGEKFDFDVREISLSRMGYVEIEKDKYVRYIPVHVTKTIPDRIEISKVGKTEFAVGEPFDISGLSVKVVYNNETELYVTKEDVTWTTPSIQYVGRVEDVVVTYQEAGLNFSTSYEIKTVADTQEDAYIQAYPNADCLTYKQGEELRLDGLQVNVIRKSGKEEPATGRLTIEVSPSLCNVGTSTVKVYYGNFFAGSYTVTVSENKSFDHPWDEGTITLDPTHISVGEKTYHCTEENCDATKTEEIPPLEGHNYGDWSKLDDKQHQRVCECGDAIVLDHDWNAGTVAVEPTYTSTGLMLYTCDDCKATYTEEIPPLEIPEDAPYIVVDSKNAVIGSTVTVKIGLQGAFGITSMRIHVAYDNALLTLTDVEYNSAMGGQGVLPENMEMLGGNVVLYWADNFKNYEGNDTFATLTFSVSENAVVDTTTAISVTYDPEDIFDADEKNVVFFCEDGIMTFVNYTPGDINGDGVVNTKDTTRLMRYLAGWDVEVNEAALDVNGDKIVNTKDTTRLMRYLAGWDVEIY